MNKVKKILITASVLACAISSQCFAEGEPQLKLKCLPVNLKALKTAISYAVAQKLKTSCPDCTFISAGVKIRIPTEERKPTTLNATSLFSLDNIEESTTPGTNGNTNPDSTQTSFDKGFVIKAGATIDASACSSEADVKITLRYKTSDGQLHNKATTSKLSLEGISG
jgi:hypothetical protein